MVEIEMILTNAGRRAVFTVPGKPTKRSYECHFVGLIESDAYFAAKRMAATAGVEIEAEFERQLADAG